MEAFRWDPDEDDNRPDMPPRPSVLVVYRDDGGKVGT